MADQKISSLTALSASAIAADDVLPIVDITANTTKKIELSVLATSVFNRINNETSRSTMSSSDEFVIFDTGSSTSKKITLANGSMAMAHTEKKC